MTTKFTIILSDPPWSYRNAGFDSSAAKQYPTMTHAQICDMRPFIDEIAADDCALFIWGTYPLLPEVLNVIDAWGFTYKSIAFQWVKLYPKSEQPFFGLGRWTRGNTEPCFLATRGKPHRVSASVSQLIVGEEILGAAIGKHSAKPPEVRDRIVQLMGDVPRIELFARVGAPGWHSWGNEL